jgi:LysM repeat protein
MEELRTELADVKHALSSAKVEMQILEEKVKNQDQSVTTLKSSSSQKGQLQSDLSQQLSLLEKRLTQLEKMQEKVGIDLRTLSSNANQGNQVLNQYKEKISSLEQEIVFQSKRLDEVSKLKSTLSSLSKAMQGSSEGSSKSYQIKSGDSLEKIARRHNTTVDNLKKLNGLNHDKIVVGQEIQVP